MEAEASLGLVKPGAIPQSGTPLPNTETLPPPPSSFVSNMDLLQVLLNQTLKLLGFLEVFEHVDSKFI